MSTAYYALAFNPFDKHMLKVKDSFPSTDLQQMTGGLEYLKTTRGIGVFTARPGMGKSFCLRCFARSLNPSLYRMEYIRLSTVSVMEFYRQICMLLGLETKGGKPGMFKVIQEHIWYLFKEKRQPLILAIDEAQFLSAGILNDLKMLMNMDYDAVNAFTLILCGEPHLNNTLSRPVHESLRQRIMAHYNFAGLNDSEVTAYILHKISVAGGSTSIIDPSAIAAVHSHCQGNPRLIDNMMTAALIIGEQMEKKTIDAEVILQAVNNQNLG